MNAKTPPNESCGSCPDLSALYKHLIIIFNNNKIMEVKFEKWLSTDRFTISIVVRDAAHFSGLTSTNYR